MCHDMLKFVSNGHFLIGGDIEVLISDLSWQKETSDLLTVVLLDYRGCPSAWLYVACLLILWAILVPGPLLLYQPTVLQTDKCVFLLQAETDLECHKETLDSLKLQVRTEYMRGWGGWVGY